MSSFLRGPIGIEPCARPQDFRCSPDNERMELAGLEPAIRVTLLEQSQGFVPHVPD